MIKDIKGEKIALTMKFPEENPWLTAAEDFAVGNVVTGKVARMTSSVVELAPGVDALLHVSQIPESTLQNHLMCLQSDRRSRLKLLISMAKTRESALA